MQSLFESAPASAGRPRPELLKPAWLEPPLRAALRSFAGFVFLYLGTLKLSVKTFEYSILGTHGLRLASGPGGFAQFLAAAGVPFPQLSAYVVLVAELLCGLGIALGLLLPLAQVLTRLFAAALAVDMLVALLAAGLPNLTGHPVLLQGVPAMAQPWRFPLELALLVAMLYFVLVPVRRPVPFVPRTLRILVHPARLRWA